METIVGRAMKENLASIRVLEKCGLTFVSDYQFDDEEGVIYSIKKNY
jgi:RimJ/RimL family protein N-acetyltransferase